MSEPQAQTTDQKMDPGTLEALQGSIAKWEAIVAGTGADAGSSNCPLCLRFLGCKGCPVRAATGQSACDGSPYDEWRYLTDSEDVVETNAGTKAVSALARDAAQKELDFLKSLLPKEHL